MGIGICNPKFDLSHPLYRTEEEDLSMYPPPCACGEGLGVGSVNVIVPVNVNFTPHHPRTSSEQPERCLN